MNPIPKNSTTGIHTIELPLASLAEGAPTRVSRDGQNFLVVRSGDEVFAYPDQCPHAFWPLSEGSVNNAILECPGHGWEFDVKTGRCLTAPGYCLAALTVRVEAGIVRLELPPAPPTATPPALAAAAKLD
jgi:nitrite reductase/ring-hydroxylating ferredoxin subunit